MYFYSVRPIFLRNAYGSPEKGLLVCAGLLVTHLFNGDFGIPLFSFFEILTLNQNINSESFRLFLTVHYTFS
jgi:hypothetical protein